MYFVLIYPHYCSGAFPLPTSPLFSFGSVRHINIGPFAVVTMADRLEVEFLCKMMPPNDASIEDMPVG